MVHSDVKQRNGTFSYLYEKVNDTANSLNKQNKLMAYNKMLSSSQIFIPETMGALN